MKNLLLPFLSLLLLAVALPAFAQESPKTAQNKTEALQMLNGSWQWTESRFASRGVPPSVKTPESTNQKIVVTFKPDNQAMVFVNSKLAGTYTYKITQQPNDYMMIWFTGGPEGKPAKEFLEEGPLIVTPTEMTISGGYNDAGSNQTFKKITAEKTQKTKKRTTRKKTTK